MTAKTKASNVMFLIFGLGILILGIAFSIVNGNRVDFDYFYGIKKVPLSILLICFFIIGTAFGALFVFLRSLKWKIKVCKLENIVNELQNKITNARSSSSQN